jgi:glycosyltransferase involved in cell wall biosynthesis
VKTLFILGFPNPVPGAAWTRIGFLAKNWSNTNSIDILGIFTQATLCKKGAKKVGNVNVFNLIPNSSLNHPAIFTINSLFSFIVSTIFIVIRRPDVTIVSMPTGDVGLGALMACSLTRVKSVVDYRDEWEGFALSTSNNESKKSFYSLIKKIMTGLYRKTCLTVTVTSGFLSNLKSRGVIKSVIMPNGADTSVFYPLNKLEIRKKLNLAESDFVIVYSGMIGNYYKLDVVLKAFANIRDSSVSLKFLMVGEGPDLPILQKLAAHLGLSDSVLYLGVKQNPQDVAAIISASDVGIIPGVYTKGQLSVKFFEYCSCGIPVIAIAPADSIIASLIDEFQVGIRVSSMDETDLGQAIKKIQYDYLFRIEAGKRARTLVEDKFDRHKIADQYLDLIYSLI